MLIRRWWILLALLAMSVGGGLADSPSRDSMPLIIAHRGASGEYPESTLLAFQMALEQGADILELDVRISSDGHPVVFHDKTLERTTDGQGPVRAHSLAQLQTLDAGYYFKGQETEDYIWRGKGLKIATLAEVLTKFPDIAYIIDIKERDELALEAITSVLRANADPKRALVFSLYDDTISRFKKLAPEFELAAAPNQVRSIFLASKFFLARFQRPDYGVLIIPHYARGIEIATGSLLTSARDMNLHVFIYTVNDLEEIKAVAAKGVSGIITDYPGLVRSVLTDYQR